LNSLSTAIENLAGCCPEHTLSKANDKMIVTEKIL
jgi:hypothetical protein